MGDIGDKGQIGQSANLTLMPFPEQRSCVDKGGYF